MYEKNEKNADLGQEFVKREPLSFQGKIGAIAPDFPEKMTVYIVLALQFHPSFPKIWCSHPNKNYIFGMSTNRDICYNIFRMLSSRLWIWWPFEYWHFLAEI